MSDDKTPRYEMSEHYHAPPVSPAAHDALVQKHCELAEQVAAQQQYIESLETRFKALRDQKEKNFAYWDKEIEKVNTQYAQGSAYAAGFYARLDSVQSKMALMDKSLLNNAAEIRSRLEKLEAKAPREIPAKSGGTGLDTAQKDIGEIFPRIYKLEKAIDYHNTLLEGVSSKKLEARIAEVVTWIECMTKDFNQRVNTLEERLKTNKETTPSTEARFEATDSRPKICMICSEHCNPAHYSGPTPGSLWRCDRCFGASEDIPYIRKLDQRVKRLEKEIPTPIDESKGPAKKLSGGGPLLTPEEKATCYVCQPRFEVALISAEEFAKERQSVKMMLFRNALAYALLETAAPGLYNSLHANSAATILGYVWLALNYAVEGNWAAARSNLAIVGEEARILTQAKSVPPQWENIKKMIAYAPMERMWKNE